MLVDELSQLLTATRQPGREGADRDAEQRGRFAIAKTFRNDEEQNLALLVGELPERSQHLGRLDASTSPFLSSSPP
jgi:hypothetical protein